MKLLLPIVLCFAALAACASESNQASTDGSGGSGAGVAGAAGSTAAPAPVGRCSYANPFSKGSECTEYAVSSWTAETAALDCKDKVSGAPGVFVEGQGCSFEASLGRCLVDDGTVVHSEGSDASRCQATSGGCKLFAKGTFEPGNTCQEGYQGAAGSQGGSGYGSTPFVQPYLSCKPPLPGEPPGKGEGGQVCTWTLISGCTEDGRRFDDYASCSDVLTQRPYYPAPPHKTTDPSDPRLSDPAYMTEVAWARQQVEASACVCCHSTRTAPEGPSQWLLDGEGVWLDTVSDSGLAMMAGLADSVALGAFPAADNNGFDRTELGLPTTDIPRMKALLLGEWARRGFAPQDGAKYPPFGGPLVDQLDFTPSACAEGEGVASDGVVSWSGGAARYLYVLGKDARSPGVPPNLDRPEGTLWLIDVPTASAPFESKSLRYGEVAGSQQQRVPAAGQAPPLVPGETYHLHVLRDVGFPITRCLFTAPGG
jgi:hypothetical protein